MFLCVYVFVNVSCCVMFFCCISCDGKYKWAHRNISEWRMRGIRVYEDVCSCETKNKIRDENRKRNKHKNTSRQIYQ